MSTISTRVAQSERQDEGEYGMEMASPGVSKSDSCLESLASQARRFAGQGAGGLESGRSKGELAARCPDRIET